MVTEAGANSRVTRIMLVGSDPNQVLEKRFKAAGYQVLKANDNQSAIDYVRREALDTAVFVSQGSLINVAEAIFNLRDLNRTMEIIVLVDRLGRHPGRFLRQLLEHPIERTRILTRRQLQKQLQTFVQQSPPGASLPHG
jgi:5S rRNA maturation endonuclease (ribonuclease M5)